MRDRTPSGSVTGSRPKTRTLPSAARSRPRTCLMRVVLPAPLAPTRPRTAPRGTARLTRSRATLAPKRRVRLRTAMTGRSGPGMGSGLLGAGGQGQVALAEQLDDLVGVDVQLPGLGQQGVDALADDLQALTPGQRRAGVGHVGAGGAAL